MRTFGLIGFPLAHSFSPGYFTKKFLKEGINDAQFLLFPLPSIQEFPKLTGTIKGICGLSVTIPYKQSVIPFLDTLSKEAQAIGAVNCILFTNGKSEGFNTDWKGFYDSIQPLLRPHHTHALVLGSGGASKAVQYAFTQLAIDFKVVSRNPGEGEFGYPDLNERVMEEFSIIVNCTPTGMFPQINDWPKIPYPYLGKNHLCYDLIYHPSETAFLQKAKQQHAVIKNGMEMLKLQAELNWKIWNS